MSIIFAVWLILSFKTTYAFERSVTSDVTTGWEVEFQTNLPGITADKVFIQGHTTPEGQFVLNNFGNIGNAKLTARKTIPMKAGYTYRLGLVYAMLFSNGSGFIDFNGERIENTDDFSDQSFNKELEVTEDMLYTITIHYEVAMRSTGYLKLGHYADNNGIDGYKTNASLIVHYVDEKGTSLIPDDQLTGIEGSEYKTEPKVLEGFDYTSVIGEETGVFTEETKEVSYVYKENSVHAGQIQICYHDEEGQQLLPDEFLTGAIGEQYTLKRKEIDAYTLDSIVGAENGIFTKDSQVVTYVYKKASKEKGQVIIHYVDEAGNSLLPDAVISGEFDEAFDITPESIEGYTLKDTQGRSTGKFSDQIQEVTYIYEKEVYPSTKGDRSAMMSPDKNYALRTTGRLPKTGEKTSSIGVIISGFIVCILIGYCSYLKNKI